MVCEAKRTSFPSETVWSTAPRRLQASRIAAYARKQGEHVVQVGKAMGMATSSLSERPRLSPSTVTTPLFHTSSRFIFSHTYTIMSKSKFREESKKRKSGGGERHCPPRSAYHLPREAALQVADQTRAFPPDRIAECRRRYKSLSVPDAACAAHRCCCRHRCHGEARRPQHSRFGVKVRVCVKARAPSAPARL